MIIYLRILFFCLIPIGIFALVKGIKLISKSFNGKVILEIPYSQESGKFSISKEGIYSIWQKGKLLKRTPIDKFRPHIYNELTNEELDISTSLLGLHYNDFSTGRMEIFTFHAPVGDYRVELKEGTSIAGLQNLITKLIPYESVDLTSFFIQIRESQSRVFTFLAIPIILFGAFGILGGFILGLLADQIIK